MDHNDVLRTNALEAYLLNELDEFERNSFEEHMFGCVACVDDLRLLEHLRDLVRGNPEFDGRFSIPHTHHAVVAYVLDDLGPTEKNSFEEHLNTCQACTRQLRLGTEIFQTFQGTLAGTAAPGARLIAAFRLFRWFQLAFAA